MSPLNCQVTFIVFYNSSAEQTVVQTSWKSKFSKNYRSTKKKNNHLFLTHSWLITIE